VVLFVIEVVVQVPVVRLLLLKRTVGGAIKELVKVSCELGADDRIELRHGEEMHWVPSVVGESGVEASTGGLETGIGCHWGRALVGVRSRSGKFYAVRHGWVPGIFHT
jgi:hypothetical protein